MCTLSNINKMAYVYTAYAVCVIFLVLAVQCNFRPVSSYTFLAVIRASLDVRQSVEVQVVHENKLFKFFHQTTLDQYTSHSNSWKNY